MGMPLVSVVIPVYNAARFLPSCMETVLGQSYRDIEVILVDDGSRDESLALCREFAAKDPRVKVYTQNNGGPGAARNLALEHITGEYVQFVDSDDRLAENATRDLVKACLGCELVIAHFWLVIGKQSGVRGLYKEDAVLDKADFLKNFMKCPGSYYYAVLWNKLYRADIILGLGLRFETTLAWGEDLSFNTQYYASVKRVHFIPQPIYYYVRMLGCTTYRTLHFSRDVMIKWGLRGKIRELCLSSGMRKGVRWRLFRYYFHITVTY